MLKLSSKQRLFVLLGVAVPTALCTAMQSLASWRPQFVGRQDDSVGSWSIDHSLLTLSADERCLASVGGEHSTVWDLNTRKQKYEVVGNNIAFSGDSQLVTAYTYFPGEMGPTIELHGAFGVVLWSKDIELRDGPPVLNFVSNDSELCYSFPGSHLQTYLDARTGRVLRKQQLPRSWEQTALEDSSGTRLILSHIVPGTKKEFSSETSNEDDIWRMAPDGKRLWVSMLVRKRFDVRDAQTGKLLWSYQAHASKLPHIADTVFFQCYPAWEDGGKTLATIENDALVVRDAQTGKILCSHKNNLSSPLKSWALTHDGKTAYLLTAKGDIYKQRLR